MGASGLKERIEGERIRIGLKRLISFSDSSNFDGQHESQPAHALSSLSLQYIGWAVYSAINQLKRQFNGEVVSSHIFKDMIIDRRI